MPRIGDYSPKITPYMPGSSPGPVHAPGLPDTGGNLAEIAIRSGTQSANAVTHSGEVGTDLLLGAASAGVATLNKIQAGVQANKAKIAEANKAKEAMLNTADVNNHMSNFRMDAADAVNAINGDMTIPPEQRPKRIKDTLSGLQQQYADKVQSNENVFTRFQEQAQQHIAGVYTKASDQVLDFQQNQALQLQKTTEENRAQGVNSPAGLEEYTKYLNSPETHQTMVNFYGPEGAKARINTLTQQAAENMLTYTADTNPMALSKMKSDLQALNITLPANKLLAADNQAALAKNRALQDAVNQQSLAGSGVKMDLGQLHVLDPGDPNYSDSLQNLSAKAHKILDEQNSLPVRTEKDELLNPVTSKPQAFRNPAVVQSAQETISQINSKREEQQRQIQAKWQSLEKGETLSQQQSIAEAKRALQARQIGPEGQRAQNDVKLSINALQRFEPGFGLTNPAKKTAAEKQYRVGADEVTAFDNAVQKWEQASRQGLIDPQYAKGVQKYLDAVHTRLITNKPAQAGFLGMDTETVAKQNAARVEKAYAHVLNLPTNPMSYVLQLHSGEKMDAINTARTSRLLNYLDQFAARNGGAMPSIEQINVVDNRLGTVLLEQQKARMLQKALFQAPPTETK